MKDCNTQASTFVQNQYNQLKKCQAKAECIVRTIKIIEKCCGTEKMRQQKKKGIPKTLVTIVLNLRCCPVEEGFQIKKTGKGNKMESE